MNDNNKVRILIVDDHPLYRQGLRQAIEMNPKFELVGEAERGRDALSMIETLQPALAVLDVGLPDITGLEVAAEIRTKGWSVSVVILTMLKDELAFNKAMSLGVRGYVLKENAVSEIISCLSTVADGKPYISPSLSMFLLKRYEKAEELAQQKPGLGDLTMAERRILKRIAEKKTSKEIAAELFISQRTVETHRANIGSKLALKGSNSLLQFALENRDSLSGLD